MNRVDQVELGLVWVQVEAARAKVHRRGMKLSLAQVVRVKDRPALTLHRITDVQLR